MPASVLIVLTFFVIGVVLVIAESLRDLYVRPLNSNTTPGMKPIQDMTREELTAALVWCMAQLRKQWLGRVYSETWGQYGSPWAPTEQKNEDKYKT